MFHLFTGSLGGGQTVTITGHGFSSKTAVTICGKTCTLDSSASQSETQYVCSTPTNPGNPNTSTCISHQFLVDFMFCLFIV